MSLITLIRDYGDVANSSEQLNGYTLSSLAYYTSTFLFTALKEAIIYFFTFHWLRDLSYFCLTPSIAWEPLSAFTNGLHPFQGFNNEINSYEHQPFSNLLAFSDSNFSTSVEIIFLGFVNGCVSCLHFSAANLVIVQRLLVRGVPAGICSAFGTAVGQLSFFMCVLFGFRGFLFPWLSLEPLPFIFGTIILLNIASSTAQDRRTPTIQWSATSSLLICAFTSFALAWCEQTAFLQWIGNVSVGTEPTFLETTPSSETVNTIFGNLQQIIQNIGFLVAFLLGNIAGAFLLGSTVQRLLEAILRYKGIAIYYGLVKQANLPLATLIFALGFGALPYYGFDFFITKGFGFDPHEHFFQQTLFSPANLVSKTSQAKEPSQGRLEDQLALLFTLEGERTKSFAIDTTPFDDGQYLRVGQKRPQSFEDLNYRGEHLWTNRLSRISNMREQANQTQSSFLGPVFSWMRSFLWGDGTDITDMHTSSNKTTRTSAFPSVSEGKQFTFAEVVPTQQKKGPDTINNRPSLAPDFLPLSEDKGISKAVKMNASIVGSIKQKREFSPEREQIENYVREFDRQFDKGFSNFFSTDPYSLIEVEDQWQEKKIKEKCYTNPIYTFLLNTEIDAFLNRQPNLHWLSPQEEVLLLKRRQLLSNYYDTLALTSQVSTSESLGQLVPKSYSNGIYNHQFKGTLKVARRLFSLKRDLALPNKMNASQSLSIQTEKERNGDDAFVKPVSIPKVASPNVGMGSLSKEARRKQIPSSSTSQSMHSDKSISLSGEDLQETKQTTAGDKSKKTRVIKFDQPLFLKEKHRFALLPLAKHRDRVQQEKTTEQPLKILFHEELGQDVERMQPNASLMPQWIQHSADEKRKEQDFFPMSIKTNPDKKSGKEQQERKFNIFLLEQAEPLPLYASWDNQLRKLLVTNRFQSRTLAGYTFSESSIFSNNRTSSKDTSWNKKEPEISTFFTTWPIPRPLIERSLANSSIVKEKNNVTYADPSHNIETHGHPSIGVRPSKEPKIPDNKGKTQAIDAIGTDFNNKMNAPNTNSSLVGKPIDMLRNSTDFIIKSFFDQNPQNRFLFLGNAGKHTEYFPKRNESITNDMVNALLQWQKLIKENKQLSKEDRQIAKERISYWPENLNRSNWSNETIDNDLEFEEPTENVVKKQTLLWEFTPPNHGGFVWPGSKTIK